MIKKVVEAVFGSRQDREVKRLQPVLAAIHAHEARLATLDEETLRGQTAKFRAAIAERGLTGVLDRVEAAITHTSDWPSQSGASVDDVAQWWTHVVTLHRKQRTLNRELKEAERALGRKCRVVMDLGGPKLRTGPLEPGPAVLRARPEKASDMRNQPGALGLVGACGEHDLLRMGQVEGDVRRRLVA